MTENAFIAGLYGQMAEQLDSVKRNEADLIKTAVASIEIVKNHIIPLREFVLDTGFQDEEEEVIFFRETKPRFYRHLIYFSGLLHAELVRPPSGRLQQQKFIRKEQKSLAYFFRKYKEFYGYLRSGASHLDQKFFLRKVSHAVQPQELEGIDKDPHFTTSHDFIVAKMLANEMLENYFTAELERLTPKKNILKSERGGLSWTAPKAALIELLYALYSSGVFNNGRTSIQQIAAFIENSLNIRLGNYYRAFQEIRIRKKNRTQFLDELKTKLSEKMDFDDEHPR